jgi:transcriptional regulator with XRE-family HTH domain
MKATGITQRELGEQLGLSQQVVSFKLKNKQLTTEELIDTVNILGVEGGMLAKLFGR